MKNSPFIVITILFAVCGCISRPNSLVHLDQNRIIEIAKHEIETKCPDFNLSDYVPERIHYSCGTDQNSERGTITLVPYRPIRPIKNKLFRRHAA